MTTPRIVRVLLADDHRILRTGLRMILTEAPPTGDDESIEVVGEAGIEATRRIRAGTGSAGGAPAVLILTTYGDDARVREAVQAGALGYLLKDLLQAELVRAVHAAARGVPTLDARAQQSLMRQLTDAPATSPFAVLTERERDVLRLIADGRSNKEIAATLFLSHGTVKGYVSAILPKLGVGDRTQAALFATKHGLT
jgi:DNA-binding NarL/FixJ family response regulator